jgi:ribosomal protein S20
MPKIKSAKKALRQSARRSVQNTARKGVMQKTIKQYTKLLAAGKTDEAKAYLPTVYKTLDKLAKVDFIKVGKAKRLKSRLTKKLSPKKTA